MKFIIPITIICDCFVGFSQTNFCGTTIQDQQSSINLQAQYQNSYNPDAATVYVPLMVHNVSNNLSLGFYAAWNLFESLCTLNEDFQPSGIQFYLEKDFNYIKNTAWNDHDEFWVGEQMMRQSNFKNMINCYLVANPAGNCGYFTYGGDGVALNKSCLGKKSHTWAHELGHYFSLPHTFFGWEGIAYSNSKETIEYQSQVTTNIENVNRDFCNNQADRFCDTEPDYISNRWTCGGDGFSNNKLRDTRDSTFRVDGSLFMSYSNDDCMSRFSNEQMDDMNQNYQGPRSALKRSNVVPKFISKTGIQLNYPIDSVETLTNHVVFSWEKITNAKYYVLQISRTVNFTIVVKNLLLTDHFVEIDSLIQGKNYWWRVRAFSEFDFCGTESEVGTFKTKEIVTSTNVELNHESYIVPNPASSFGLVQINSSVTNQINTEILIHDLNGKVFTPKSIILNPNSILVELGYLPDGLYFLSNQNAKASHVYKLIVKNK